MQGKLICLYGIDGSGKSTILEMLNNSKLKNTVCTSCLKKAIFEEELYQAEKNFIFIDRMFFLMNSNMYFILAVLFIACIMKYYHF